jgi:hypothetical protein
MILLTCISWQLAEHVAEAKWDSASGFACVDSSDSGCNAGSLDIGALMQMQMRAASTESVELRQSGLDHQYATIFRLSDGLTGPGPDDPFWWSTGLLMVAFLLILNIIVAKTLGLTTGFIAYFVDNVLVMLMADSASLVGTGFFWFLKEQRPISEQWLGLSVNALVTLVLWFVAKKYHGTTHATDTATHVLDSIPWIIKVGMLNLLGAYHRVIAPTGTDRALMGETLTYDFLFFLGLFPVAWFINTLEARLSYDKDASMTDESCAVYGTDSTKSFDKGDDKYSLANFLHNTVNGGFQSCTGKAMHYCVHVIIFSLHDHTNPDKSLKAYGGMELVVLLISSFFLINVLPKMDSEEHHESRAHLAFLVIYCWAFSFVDFTWWLFYFYLGASSIKGQILFWMFIMFLLNFALVLAWVHNGNFYGGSSELSRCTANMLCWAIEFGAWWAWAQAMTDFDKGFSPYPGCSMTRMFNVAATIALLLLIVAVQKLVDIDEMLEHRAAKAAPMGKKKSKASKAPLDENPDK